MTKLTGKREQFAKLVALGNNHTEAYRQVYETKNMQPKSIWTEAWKVANVPEVSQRIEELKKTATEMFREDQQLYAQTIRTAATEAKTEIGLVDHKTRLKASETALKFAGLEPAQKVVNVNLNKEDVEEMLGNL